MKRDSRILLLVLAVLAVAGWTQSNKRVQWEYRAETSSLGKPAPLNQLGADGWELVAVIEHTGLQTEVAYFLKRQR